MQKFTRAITREIEMDGERIALTFDDKGIQIRTVGSRRPPATISWPAVVCQATTQANAEPSSELRAQAIDTIRGQKKAAKPAGEESIIVSPGPAAMEMGTSEVIPSEAPTPPPADEAPAGAVPADQEHIT